MNNQLFNHLPPPPTGQTGITLDQFKGLPPPPSGQQGVSLQDAQAKPVDNRNLFQKGLGLFLDPIINTGTRLGQVAGSGLLSAADALSGGAITRYTQKNNLVGIDKALKQDVQVPITGTQVAGADKITAKNTLGNAISTVALGVGSPAAGGALLGLGGALQQDKSAGNTAIDTVGGAIGGKILEHGFNAVAPYIEKAAVKYGSPFLEKIAQYVPESAKGFIENLSSKVGIVGDKISTVGNKIGDTQILPQVASNAVNKGEQLFTKAVEAPFNVVSKGTKAVINAVTPDSATLMGRVARMKPTDITKFTDMTGETPGQYLTRTGNFGNPEKILTTEAQKFTKNLNTVDTEIAKLPGLYETDPLKTMSSELLAREQRISSAGASSPDLTLANELNNKLNNGGLNMSEVNALKRLYERNVKLDFARQQLPEATARANVIDNAVRSWQFKQAKDLGFTNLDKLNKQTQASKFIIDKLGDTTTEKGVLNGMNLTDWIMLSGGEPSSVAGFLTKKFFSSKGVQAGVAKLLNKAPVEGMVLPDTSITTGNLQRQVSPKGLPQLPSGDTLPPNIQYSAKNPVQPSPIQNNVAIQGLPATTIEPQATNAFTSRPNAKGGMNVTDLKNNVTFKTKNAKRK